MPEGQLNGLVRGMQVIFTSQGTTAGRMSGTGEGNISSEPRSIVKATGHAAKYGSTIKDLRPWLEPFYINNEKIVPIPASDLATDAYEREQMIAMLTQLRSSEHLPIRTRLDINHLLYEVNQNVRQ